MKANKIDEDDADRDRRVYIDEMSRMQSDVVALQAEAFRQMAINAVLQLAVTARRLKDHTARGPVAEWLTINRAAYRYGCCGERMRQMAHAGDVVSRRDRGGPISILTASLDERIRLLCRAPHE